MGKILLYGRLLTLLTCLVALSGCDEDLSEIYDDLENEDTEKVEITSYKFSPNCKYLDVFIKQNADMKPFVLNDSNRVSAEVYYGQKDIFNLTGNRYSKIRSFKEVGSQEVDSLKMKMLILIDLTLPQEIIDNEYYAVREIRNMFSERNLYLAFITPQGVSETIPATDGVMDSHFKYSGGNKFLFRAILTKTYEMASESSVFAESQYDALVIFSDGVVYEGDIPIDPDHYNMQEQLIERGNELGKNDKYNLFFVKFTDVEVDDSETASNLMKLVCRESNGEYQDNFKWPTLKKAILSRFNLDIADYKLTLENADGMVFRGSNYRLNLQFNDARADTLLTETQTRVRAGSVFKPIIVNGESLKQVILQGILWQILNIILLYLILQYLVPYIRYRRFLSKYVHKYTGNNMIFNDKQVGDTCYYCKGAFEEGEDIVVKCEHTMHLSCWEENDQHCTEYGRHCKTGSHYYNRANLSDPKNATFYMKWAIMSIIAGTVAWIVFLTTVTNFTTNLLEEVFQFIYGVTPSSRGYQELLTDFGENFYQLPLFGLWISFFTTFFLSLLTVFNRERLHYYGECLLRAIVAGFGGWLSFGLVAVIGIIIGLSDNSFILAWLPWPLAGCIIALCVTWHTRIKFRKYWVLISLLLGLISMALWTVIYVDSVVDFRGVLLFSHVLFSLGLGLAIAKEAPRSEHYFLRVDGSVKTMDVALYKWFRNNADEVVNIGRSVDCHLQLSWDINADIAPLHAEICRIHDRICLVPIEEGVTSEGKPLEKGEALPLYHGTQFTIGKTNFTYLEKDL